MTKLMTGRWLLLALMYWLLSTSQSMAQSLPPFTVAASLNRSTMTIDIEQQLTRAYQTLGYRLEIQYLPAERSLKMTNQGKFDGELFRISSITKQYPNLIVVPVPLAEIELFAFVKEDPTIDVVNWQHNTKLRIGYVRGFKMAEHYDFAGAPVVLNTTGQAVQMLQQGRVDILLEDLVSLQDLIDGPENSAGLRRLEPVLAKEQVFHVVHQKQQQLVEPLAQQLLLQQRGKNLINSTSGSGRDQK